MRIHEKEPSNLSDILNRYLHTKGYSRHGAEVLAAVLWAETVGPWYARHTEVIRVENGAITVHCDSAPLAQQLVADSDRILERLNQRVAEQLAASAPAEPGAAPPQVLREIRATSAFQGRGEPQFRSAERRTSHRPPADEIESLPLTEEEEARAQELAAQVVDDQVRRRFLAALRASLRLRQWQVSQGWQPCSTCDRLLPPEDPLCLFCKPPPAPLQVRS